MEALVLLCAYVRKAERLRYVHGGSHGSVFQTVLPYRAGIRRSKAPRLLRDRPSDGAAGVRRLCERWRLLCADCEVELSKMPMSVFMGGEALRLPLADGRVRWEQRGYAAIAKTT